jgi:ABC-type multidrug transport system fused ATPase/permease subunit
MKQPETTPRYPTLQLVHDLYGFVKPYKGRYSFATLMRLIGDLVQLYPTYALAQMVTFLGHHRTGEPHSTLWFYIATSGIAFVIHVVCRQIARVLGYRVSERSALDAHQKTLQHLFRLDLAWHEKENSGNKMKRIQTGTEAVDNILRMWITNFIEIGVNFVAITVILATFNGLVAILFIVYMAIYFIVSRIFTTHAVVQSNRVNIGEEKLYGLTFEAINNIRSVKVLGMSAPIMSRVQQRITTIYSDIKKRIFWYQGRYLILDNFTYIFYIGMILMIVWGIIDGKYQLGFLVLFMGYFAKISENIDELTVVTLDFNVAKFGLYRMQAILNEPVGIDDDQGKQVFPEKWDKIRIENLSFTYDNKRPILHNISFEINRGEKVGIVGISGAGKSTLFKLLLKEHEQYDGVIKIGEVPLRDIRKSDFFHHAAVVLQDTEVFSFSLRDNITIGNAGQSDNTDLLKQAVDTAHVDDFLPTLSEGLDTLIGEKGVKLSGGEKQRIGLARAVFKQPEILFLDEATSHLDMESEKKIQDSLHHFFKEVTAIVIAHRLTTIQEMDRIIVIQAGKIVEQGSFSELLQKKGRFAELWSKQGF